MKELAIEQKAKAYDEAIERAKEMIKAMTNIGGVAKVDDIQYLFPELKESEDEKIKEGLIDYFNNFHLQTFAGLEPKKILNWLEKQGEQKSFARYKVGDTIYYNSFGRLVSFTITNVVEDGTDNPMYEDKDGNSVFQNDIVEQKPAVVDFKAKDWYVSKVDGKIYNDKFMEKPTNQARKLEIEKAAMSATGIIEQEEWFIKGAEWSDKNPYISSEKQGEQKPINKIQLGKKYKCIASPRYSTFMLGEVYRPKDEFLCSLMNFCSDCFEPIEDGEQKSDDKVEPNFHFEVGQWIVTTGKCVYLIAKIDGFNVTLVDTNGDKYVFDVSSLDDAHEWTIQDAKKGDVLEFGDHGRLVIGIVSYVNKSTGKIDVSCLLEDNKFKIGIYYALDTINPHPVTKEQYNTFKNAMIDAGYIFDFEKKILRKLKFRIGDEIKTANEGSLTITRIDCFGYWSDDLFICSFENSARWELVEQEPVEWSEEDENMLKMVIKSCEQCGNEYAYYWLKSLKDRVQPQPQWKPSEEQMHYLSWIANVKLGDGVVEQEVSKHLNELLENLETKRLKL